MKTIRKARNDLPSDVRRAYIDLEKGVIIDRHDIFKYCFNDMLEKELKRHENEKTRGERKMKKTVYIKVGDTFTNNFDNTCTIERISEPLVICSEEICQTDDGGYTETVGAKEARYTMQEMKRMFNCKYLHVGDPDEDNEDEE